MLKGSIDQIVKNKLGGIEKEPPEYVWSTINQRLLEDKKRRRIVLYWQSAAAIALILLSLGIFFTVSDRDLQVKKLAKNNELPEKIVTEQNEISTAGNEKNKLVAAKEKRTEYKKADSKDQNIENNKIEKTAGENIPVVLAVVDKKKEQKVSDIYDHEISVVKGEGYVKAIKYEPIDHLSLLGEIYIPAKSLKTTAAKLRSQPREMLYASNTPEVPVYKPKNRKVRFVIGGIASPTYNYRSVGGANEASVVYRQNTSPLNETGIVSVSGGVNLRMESNSRWSFETGVFYSQVGQEVSNNPATYNSMAALDGSNMLFAENIKNVSVNIGSVMDNSLGEVRMNSNDPVKAEKSLRKNGVYFLSNNYYDNADEPAALKQLLDYIEVPLMARYALFESKTVISISGGFSTNFLVDNTAYFYKDGELVSVGSTDGIDKVTYSSTVGIGMELPLGRSFRFSFEPRFKYFLSPVNNQGAKYFHPYSFGVFGGVSFIFNNR